MTHVLVSAGEPSGDRHAGRVLSALRGNSCHITADAVGGTALCAAGAKLIAPLERLSATGLFEGLGTLPAHVRLLQRLERRFAAGTYDLVVLVDYPGFHLRVAQRAARHGVPVLYYIAPQLWAWGGWRAERLRRHVRRLAVILPFEEAFFRARGIGAEFVGHPLLDDPVPPSREDARRQLRLHDGTPVVALFPGSRMNDVARHWPTFRDAALQLREEVPDLAVLVAADVPETRQHGLLRVPPDVARAAADAALVKSGTATLEAALAGLPMVVSYRMHPVTFAVARRLVQLPHVGLVNLLAGGVVTPELLQDEARPAALARALLPLLDRDGRAARAQRDAFSRIRNTLGSRGAARRVAAMALELAA